MKKYKLAKRSKIRSVVSSICLCLLTAGMLFLISCGEEDPNPQDEVPLITAFSPISGTSGSEVVITGSGFGLIAGSNDVTIDDVQATVISASATSLTIVVPMQATTGQIKVTVGDVSATSADSFTVLPAISQIIPPQGAVNALVTIHGSGFSTTVTENLITLDGQAMTAISANVNEVTFQVPEGANSGNVEIEVNGNSATGPSFDVVVEAVAAGGIGYDNGYAIAVDGDGNVYIAGSFQETMSFGSTTLQSADGEDIFVAKYNDQSELLWAKRAGGTYADRASEIVLDGSGNIYIAGYISSTANFGTLTATAFSTDVFVAQMNSSGDFTWLKTFGGNDTDGISDLIIDNDNNLVLTGGFKGTISFGATSLISDGDTDVFVAKLTPASGDAVWARSFGGTADSFGQALGAGSGGELFVAGSFFGTSSFDTQSFTAPQDVLNSFVLKLNSTGEVTWVNHIAGSGWNNTYGVAIGPDGNCVVTGYFSNTTTFGSLSANPVSHEDVFIAKYAASDGVLLWVETAGGSDFDKAEDIVLDGDGNIYFTGYVARTGNFAEQTFNTDENSQDVFVSKYDADGNFQWLRIAGGADFDSAFSIALGPSGILHVTGFFRNVPGLFESTELPNIGGDDMFVWKIWPQ